LGGPVSLEAVGLLRGRVRGVVLVDATHGVDEIDSVANVEADAARLRADFRGYFSDLSSLFSKSSDPDLRGWVESQAMASYPPAVIGLKLDRPNLNLKKLFQDAGVPLRGINAESATPVAAYRIENQKYADYDVVVMADVGHFLMLERPQRFNRLLAKSIAELSR
jgi:pimeloyl-ACP methyl ester carboxylesterase